MNAIVTGGCKGLGLSFTKELARRGYHVYALYNTSLESAKELECEIITPIHCDITNEEDIIKSLPSKIDLLINNAGIAIDNEYVDKSKEEFMRVVEVNLGGTYLMTKHVIPKLTPEGIVVNVSSNNAIDNNSPLSMDYDASKAGINMLTKDFALADTHKFISICPGWINTEEVRKMNPNYLQEEMDKVNQKEIIDPDALVVKILDNLSIYSSGDIIEIKEL